LIATRAIVVPALASLLLCAGCTAGPEFVSPLPQVATAKTYLDTGKPVRSPLKLLAGTQSSEPEAEWWRVFHDPILSRLEARVSEQNLDVQTATLRLAESRAALGNAAAAGLPTVSGAGSVYREQYSQNGIVSLISKSGAVPSGLTSSLGTPLDSYTAGFDASWELDLWGRVRRSIEASQAQVDSSAEARRDTLVSNLAELARDYVQLRGTQDQIRINLANVKINEDILGLVRTRQQRGLVTGLDTASAASQVEGIRAQLPQLQQQEIQLINAISLILDEPPLALSNDLITAKAVPPIPPRIPLGVPSDLLLRRPDIRRSEADLHAAVAQIGVAEAQFFPTVTITGSPTFNALGFNKLFTGNSLQYMNVGPSVSVPIFDGGRLKSNLVMQEARQQEAAIAYQKTVLQAWHDVVNALAALKADEARRLRLQAQVGDAHRALSLARSRYSDGVETFTTVLTNEQTVLQAEMELSRATAGISTDLVALYKALGGGWETTFPDRPVPPLPLQDVAIPSADLPHLPTIQP
jgi:NodT family efflux transporter outer membrane factor (OMF) lipoprotein